MEPYRNSYALDIQTHDNRRAVRGSLTGAFLRLSALLTVSACVN